MPVVLGCRRARATGSADQRACAADVPALLDELADMLAHLD
jgi:hypothetical protein